MFLITQIFLRYGILNYRVMTHKKLLDKLLSIVYEGQNFSKLNDADDTDRYVGYSDVFKGTYTGIRPIVEICDDQDGYDENGYFMISITKPWRGFHADDMYNEIADNHNTLLKLLYSLGLEEIEETFINDYIVCVKVLIESHED